MGQQIRLYEPEDETAVVAVWHRAGLAAYSYLPTWQSFPRELARTVFRDHILPNNQIWVGTDDGQIVAYLAISGSLIDRLYIDPQAQRQGWGTRLIQLAKTLSPAGLELFTHQENYPARSLYEKHGFVAVAFGLSPPPESAPDVTYQWRP